MRRFALTAILAVPILFVSSGTLRANPLGAQYFGCAGHCFKAFPYIHQHGPLFNYGPYYGYYPFCPYGPWDAYLRFDPGYVATGVVGDVYGWHPRLRNLYAAASHVVHWTADFWHASWLHGGWFRGHKWLDGGHGCSHAPGCSSCGGVAVPDQPVLTGDPTKKYSGIGTPSQSAVFYGATPTLDPRIELAPARRTR